MKVVRRIVAVLHAAERLSAGSTQSFDDSKIHHGKTEARAPRGESFFADALEELNDDVRDWIGRWEARIENASKRPPSRFDGTPEKWAEYVRTKPEYEGKSDSYIAAKEGVSRELVNKVRRGARHAA